MRVSSNEFSNYYDSFKEKSSAPQNNGKQQTPKPPKPEYPMLGRDRGSVYSTVTYKNSKGQYVTAKNVYKTNVEAMKMFNKYFKNGKITMTNDTKSQILQEIATRFPSLLYGYHDELIDLNKTLKDAFDEFTSEDSLGGKDIVEQEIYKLYERMIPINKVYGAKLYSSQN